MDPNIQNKRALAQNFREKIKKPNPANGRNAGRNPKRLKPQQSEDSSSGA